MQGRDHFIAIRFEVLIEKYYEKNYAHTYFIKTHVPASRGFSLQE